MTATPVLIHGDFRVTSDASAREYARTVAENGVTLHPAERALLFHANRGDESAAAILEDAKERLLAKERLVDALGKMHQGRTTDTDASSSAATSLDDDRPSTRMIGDGMQAVYGYYVGPKPDEGRDPTWRSGVRRLHVDAPKLYPEWWGTNPRDLAERLRMCSSSWMVFDRATGTEAGSAPCGCDLGFCPFCLHNRGGSRIRKYLPIAEVLAARGYRIVHITATRPADLSGRRPVVLLEHEAPLYRHRVAKYQGRAVPGEPLRAAVDALVDPERGAWRNVSNKGGKRTGGASSNREWWRASVAAAWRGVEWTGRTSINPDRSKPPFVLRWHAHLHILAILRPGVDVGEPLDDRGSLVAEDGRAAGPWVEEWLRRWCKAMPGAKRAGQAVQLVGGAGQPIAGALKEVLKYPFKPAELTIAQIGEVLASVRGDHLHVTAGQLHGSSRVMKVVRGLLTPEGCENELVDRLSDDELGLAQDIHDGILERRRRDLESAVELLYRRRHPDEVPRVGEMGRQGPADGPADVVGVTVRWLAREMTLRGADVRVPLWSYNPASRSWTGPADVSVGELFVRVTQLRSAVDDALEVAEAK